MKKVLLLVCVSVLMFSCDKKQEKAAVKKESCTSTEKDSKGKKKFEMYTMSEMSLLMEQMYLDNQNLKSRIQNGEKIGAFPSHFLKIHKAVMSDDKENDDFFKKQAANFIAAQEQIYKDPENAKMHFNKGIDACIQCHKVKCGGPIPRIKKLYIE
ncbi:hypothetical protein HYN48_11800 [Flavobacterium magnum]|uniref:Cytochrome C n=1 Tax=Flavobacterium magnum TaxID=2162713 RepID=A0A2S0RGH0_9FLAO|nr:hypothetical protein [Flavobacterium magnum]AWA30715.1 hypothetical protein HYN48_11800 [Flavobacterium magnum]